jgi:hypothetical protein
MPGKEDGFIQGTGNHRALLFADADTGHPGKGVSEVALLTRNGNMMRFFQIKEAEFLKLIPTNGLRRLRQRTEGAAVLCKRDDLTNG